MLTPRQNVLAILHGQQPEYYGDLMDALRFAPDPDFVAGSCPADGVPRKDTWGVTRVRLPGSPGAHPVCTPETLVITDIEKWEEQIIVPPVEGLDWTQAEEWVKTINRDEYFVTVFMPTGLFERSHFLMGMEEALCNYLEYPDEMAALLRVVCDWKKDYIREAYKHIQPDAVFYQDDWGSKQNLFLPPGVWRDIIKPLQQEISDVFHELGILYVHHADCICQPIATDMVELGIDVWQGVIPENDIVEIQRITNGKLPMIGGIDVPAFDNDNASEKDIRAEVRRAIDTYVPGGPFFPGMPAGCAFNPRVNDIFVDELKTYGRLYAQRLNK